jgi:hypothetical protein
LPSLFDQIISVTFIAQNSGNLLVDMLAAGELGKLEEVMERNDHTDKLQS